MKPRPGAARMSGLTLNYPRSLGVFEKYDDAQRAVDHLSDRDFPVQNCMIVGTDLRQVERVTGRLTWARVVMGGLASGVWLGLFVGLVIALFSSSGDALLSVVWCVAFGAAFGLVWAMVGYGYTRGARDFTSVSQVVATRYEVLTEHKFADQARTLLDELTFGAAPSNSPGASETEPAGERAEVYDQEVKPAEGEPVRD